jgi:hypothetical protein
VRSAEFYALLARALPGTSYHDLQWNVSLTHAWSLIHASGILHGSSYVWPDPRLSEAGQTMLRVRDKVNRWKREGISYMIDL